MTIADDQENPRPTRRLGKSLDAITALRMAMEQRLHEESAAKAETAQPVAPQSQEPSPSAAKEQSKPSPALAPQPETRAEAQHTSAKPVSPAEPAAKTSPSQHSASPSGDRKTEAKGPTGNLYDPTVWPHVTLRIAERVQRLLRDYARQGRSFDTDLTAFNPSRALQVMLDVTDRILKRPEHFVDAQIALWQGYAKLWQTTFERLQGKPVTPVITPSPADKRFSDQEWQTNLAFDLVKQSYLLTSQWVHSLVQHETEKLEPHQAQKIEFYTKQMMDALSPSNFWMTNPEVLRTTLATGGDNLVKGLENLLGDLEKGHGLLRIRMTDMSSFSVGKNIATTPGEVVFQNDLMQLIQYAPSTATVRKTPLLVIPPWINKYYILDLREKNSLLRYLVDQGHTVFCISWVNPTAKHALTNFDDYMESGALAALRAIKAITAEDEVNVTGYCVGGTLLATSLAYMEALPTHPADLPNVKSATFLTTMVDFAEPGDIGVFIDEEHVTTLEHRMARQGYLDAAIMATSFNLLRANDLIWSFVVNNYLLGKEPFPFDILYWNGDSTNLPAVMHSFYLRRMYMANKLVEPDGLSMKGVPIDLRRITTPTFMLSTIDDHIAPWRSTYAATQLYQGDKTFVLAGSGHIAGVVNPPAANKYGYWTNPALPADPEVWLKGADKHAGSWWPRWMEWLNSRAGEQVAPRIIKGGIEPAPGSYVKKRAL